MFLTRVHPNHFGGLIGWLCTLFTYDTLSDTKVYGPKGLINLFENMSAVMRFNLVGFSSYSFFEGKKLLGIKKKD